MFGLAANLSQNIGPKLSKQIQLEWNPKNFKIVLKQYLLKNFLPFRRVLMNTFFKVLIF